MKPKGRNQTPKENSPIQRAYKPIRATTQHGNILSLPTITKGIQQRKKGNNNGGKSNHGRIENSPKKGVHAMENSRLKGEYLITKVKEVGNTGLVCADLTQKAYKGIKHGKSVVWEA